MVLPSRVITLLAAALVLSVLGLVFINKKVPKETLPIATPTVSPSATATPTKSRAPKPKLIKTKYQIVVFNNTSIKGFAAATASRITKAGWRVVGYDNWFGTIPGTTVYYPNNFLTAAKALAKDLKISRIRPAVSPMRSDRLTLILTEDFN